MSARISRIDYDIACARYAAAEARCAELEAQTARDKKTVASLGYKMGATDMREGAADLVRGMEPNGFDPRRFVDQIADAVEALPLDAETPALEDDHG